MLNRAIDTQAEQYFEQLLTNGVSRETVALDVLQSVEADQEVVQGDYQDYLGRPADEAGLTYWVDQLQQGLRERVMLSTVLGSDEFFSKL